MGESVQIVRYALRAARMVLAGQDLANPADQGDYVSKKSKFKARNAKPR
jgi:hypothetical protein